METPLVREYTANDLDAFRAIHVQSGLDYKFPDLSSPLFLSKVVIERAGMPATLLAGRLCVETYLMTSGTPRERVMDIAMAQRQFLNDLWEKGVDDVYCSVPNVMPRSFSRLMNGLGWQTGREGWTNYYRDTV